MRAVAHVFARESHKGFAHGTRPSPVAVFIGGGVGPRFARAALLTDAMQEQAFAA